MFSAGLFGGLPIPQTSTGIAYLGTHEIVLVEDRANEISVPHISVDGIDTRLMAWNPATQSFVSSAAPTRISEFCKQLNRRYTGSETLSPAVVARCEAVDADTGNRLVFTPGATVVGSLQDFEVIILDQDGDFESRGFLLFLTTDANPGAVDGGQVVLRLSPHAFPWL